MVVVLAFLSAVGCKAKKENEAERPGGGRALFEQTIKEFHNPSAEAMGTNRERLLSEAARRYEQLLKEYPKDEGLCAEALLGFGNIRALQGKTNEAVKLYATVSEKYPNRDWEVLQAWKAAADLLWDARRRDDAKKYYARIVERFDKSDAPMITKTVVRGSKSRLAE
jgi:tetratricopeptide (TPR) repeat protein